VHQAEQPPGLRRPGYSFVERYRHHGWSTLAASQVKYDW